MVEMPSPHPQRDPHPAAPVRGPGAGGAGSCWEDLDPFIAAYERCQEEQGDAVLSEFLPAPDHPHFQAVLAELIRVDLEFRWSKGCRKPIEDYLREFPQLSQDAASLQGIAYEEYRLRCQAGERPSLQEYRQRFGLDTGSWSHVRGPDSEARRTPATVFGSSAPGGAKDGLELTAFLCLQQESLLRLATPQAPHTKALAQLLLSRSPAGIRFLGFTVLRELGRGARARVYLAQQEDLADRQVVLKISADQLREPQLLAQLQHTHIVPIFSVHAAHPFQVFCMPYFGTTTLADVVRALRQEPVLPASGRWLVGLLEARGIDLEARRRLRPLEAMTYVESILWLGARLAEGLEHAHQRGIVHGDLKPANILLGDDGRPLLLDFNLARDTRQNGDGPPQYFGGTLPYMAPEQLGSFAEDGRRPGPDGDVYALGVVLCELLTGKPPYPVRTGTLEEVLAAMSEDRKGPLPPLRQWNPVLSPAEAAILSRCLAPDPARRYASAAALREDIERHRANLPLQHIREPSLREQARKWVRRHPRFTSAWSVAAAALLVLGALGTLYEVRDREAHRYEAIHNLQGFEQDLRTCRFLVSQTDADPRTRQRSLQKMGDALARYRLPEDPDWESAAAVTRLPESDRERLRAEVGELFFLDARALRLEALASSSAAECNQHLRQALAMNERAEQSSSGRFLRPIRLQRSLLLEALGKTEQAAAIRHVAECLPAGSATDLYLLALEWISVADWNKAVNLLEEATRLEPDRAILWFTEADCHAHLGHYERARACFDTSIALWSDDPWAFYGRGQVHLVMGADRAALADFDRAIALDPDILGVYVYRSMAKSHLKDDHGALADLDRAVAKGIPQTGVYFKRALVRERLGDAEGARRDREEGLRRRPTDDDSWVERGVERLKTDPRSALEDMNEALRLNPRSFPALLDKADILSETLGRTREAVEVLDEAVKHYPESSRLRASRGVLLARLGRRPDALADAREALRLDRGAATLYQVAGIYALTSTKDPDDRFLAYGLLALALLDGEGFDLLATDPELRPVRDLPEFRRLVEALEKLRGKKEPGAKNSR
jgi:serine/threonine protein kinase/predicted Zn-dependent protease